jgi:hypothetical protein
MFAWMAQLNVSVKEIFTRFGLFIVMKPCVSSLHPIIAFIVLDMQSFSLIFANNCNLLALVMIPFGLVYNNMDEKIRLLDRYHGAADYFISKHLLKKQLIRSIS